MNATLVLLYSWNSKVRSRSYYFLFFSQSSSEFLNKLKYVQFQKKNKISRQNWNHKQQYTSFALKNSFKSYVTSISKSCWGHNAKLYNESCHCQHWINYQPDCMILESCSLISGVILHQRFFQQNTWWIFSYADRLFFIPQKIKINFKMMSNTVHGIESADNKN